MNEPSLCDDLPTITLHSSNDHISQPTATTSHDHNYDNSSNSLPNNPCTVCGQYEHRIPSVNRLAPNLHPCFPVPELVSNDKPKRRINKLARALTTESMIEQVKEKEKQINQKKERSEKRKANTIASCNTKKVKVQGAGENTQSIVEEDAHHSMYKIKCKATFNRHIGNHIFCG